MAIACFCNNLNPVKPEDVRTLWWADGVREFIRRYDPENIDWLWLSYLVMLGELIGRARIEAYPETHRAYISILKRAHVDLNKTYPDHPSFEEMGQKNGVHATCPHRLALLKERISRGFSTHSFYS